MNKIVWVFISNESIVRMGGIRPDIRLFKEYPIHWVEIRT